MSRVIVQIFFLALLVFSHAARSEPEVGLHVTLPGDIMCCDTPEQQAPPAKLPYWWYSASINGGNLKIEPVTQTRQSDWIVTRRPINPSANSGADGNAKSTPNHSLDLPGPALLGFRFSDRLSDIYGYKDLITSPPLIPFGTYPSAAAPFLLTTDLRVPIGKGKDSWILSTEYIRRKDGKLLAGSLSLIATNPSGERMVVVPPGGGAFIRQEVLWVGRIAARTRNIPKDSVLPSLIMRRTWLTGGIDYVVVIDGAIGGANFNPDRPTSFSNFADDDEVESRHITQHRQPPSDEFGVIALDVLGVREELWDALSRIEATGMPGMLFDRQLVMNTEPVRFTIEYLPVYSESRWHTSSGEEIFWQAQALLKVHFRGKSQVLLQVAGVGIDSLRVHIGQLLTFAFVMSLVVMAKPRPLAGFKTKSVTELTRRLVNGGLAIQASTNFEHTGFSDYWVWSEADGRFLNFFGESGGC